MKMSPDDISALFGNVESVYNFNRYGIFEELFFVASHQFQQ